MRPDQYSEGIRADGTASYLEINPTPPPISSRVRGWDGIVVEHERFLPFDNGNVIYDEHFLGVIDSPSMRMLYRGEDRSYEGEYHHSDVIVSPAGQPVRWRVDEPSDAMVLVLPSRFIDRIAEETAEVDPAKARIVAQPRVSDPLVRQWIGNLLAEVRGGGLGERLYFESLATALSIHLLRRYSSLAKPIRGPRERGLPARRLRRAIELMRDRIETGVSLAEVAEAAGMSPSHFAALFKRSTGFSPHQYLIRCRVQLARELLRDPEMTLAEIAARAGFADQGHLARQFRRIEGITPTRFRSTS